MSEQTRYPYLIMAPDYRESSLGVQVLHRLCHLLNEAGQQAFVSRSKLNPEWNTSVISNENYDRFVRKGEPFIAVYPEVYSGNPFNAPVSVRYMLNREGVVNRNSLGEKADDLFFWYREEFAEKAANPRLLDIEFNDLNLFCDDQPEKDLTLLYINRVATSAIDFSQFPEGIKVLSMDNPLPLPELAAILKRGKVLYSYESSGTCTLAVLCGCPVVALVAPGYEKHAITPETLKDCGDHGFSWSDDAVAIAQARANVGLFRERLLERRAIGTRRLHDFIAITQQQVQQVIRQKNNHRLDRWLAHRTARAGVIMRLAKEKNLPRLLVVLQQRQASEAELSNSLATLLPQIEKLPGSKILVVSSAARPAMSSPELEWLTENNWQARVAALTEAESFEWVHCTQAGVHYFPDSIRLVAAGLDSEPGCHVRYADEIFQQADAYPTPCFKPQFDRTLFFSSPHLYCQRLFIRRDALLAVGGFDHQYAQAFEFATLVKLLQRFGPDAIQPVKEIIASLADALRNTSAAQDESLVLQHFLDEMGFGNGAVEVVSGKPYRLHYGHQLTPRVSIILPAGNDVVLLQRCITQLLENMQWADFELLVVVHQQDNPEMQAWLKGLATVDPRQIKVLNSELPAQATGLINQAASQSQGDYLLLLDVHTAFVHNRWLNELMNHAQLPEVGCVGPKIIKFNQQILTAGFMTGYNGPAGSVGYGEHWESEGYLQRLQSDQTYTVLSALCLLVRRTVWQEIGGFDQQYTDPLVADIALCMKIKQAGYQAVWTPRSLVASDNPQADYGQLVANADSEQSRKLYLKWLPQLADDRAGNPHFSLRDNPFSPDFMLPHVWQPRLHPQSPVVIAIDFTGTNSAAMRLHDALSLLSDEGHLNFIRLHVTPSLPELARLKPAAIILSGEISSSHIEQLEIFSQCCSCLFHYVPDAQNNTAQDKAFLRSTLIDRWLVYSPALEKWLSKRQRNTLLMPVLLSSAWQPAMQTVREPERLRLLCQPSSHSPREKQLLFDVMEQTAAEVDWVVLGPCPREWLPFVKETHRLTLAADRQEKLRSLQISLAVVPRMPEDDNRYSDDLALTELAASHIPVLCSDHPGLHNGLAAWRAGNIAALWVRAIKEREFAGQSLASLAKRGDEMLDAVNKRTHENLELLLAGLLTASPAPSLRKKVT